MKRERVHSTAKTTRPAFSGVCLRKRLFARIDKGRKRPVVWVCGPPGAGKTILASSYIETRGLPCLWYQADRGDSDLATFFYYMRGAASRARGGKGAALPLFTPEYAHGPGVFSRRFFEGLFAGMKSPSCLVIDNCHEAAPGSAFCDALSEGISAMPEGVSAIILSRSAPPASFSKLAASGRIEVIGPDELVFTPQETERMAELRLGKKWARKSTEEVLTRTRGWAAGLAIMLEEERSGVHGKGPGDARTRLSGYFASEFFNRMDERTKSLLLKTSLLSEFDGPTAGRIAGIREAEEVLSALHRENFFTERRGSVRPAYQYHPLFREFLREELEKTFGQDGLRRLMTRSASVLDELGDIEQASELLILASEWDLLAKIIKSSARALMAQGRHLLVGRWLSSLPERALREDPWLLMWSGAALLPTDPASARKRLAEAYGLFKDLKDPDGLYIAWSAAADTFFYEWKDFRGLDVWIRELELINRKFPGYPSREIEARVVAAMFSALVFRQPHNPHLPLWEKRAREIFLKPPAGADHLPVGSNLLFYYLWTGNYARARVIIDRLSGSMDAGAPGLPGISWCFVNALYSYHSSCYREALDWVDRGLALSDASGVALMKAKLSFFGSISSVSAGRDTKEAERYSRSMGKDMDPSSNFDLACYHQQAARVSLAKKDTEAAIEHARVASKCAEASGAPFLAAMTEAVFSSALIEAGESREAEKRLAKLSLAAKETQSLLLDYIRLMNEALLFLNAGDERKCAESLAMGLALAKKHAICFLPTNLPEATARLLAKALKTGVEPGFASELIRANSLVCPDPDMEAWPYDLSVRALGPFEVFKGGKPIEFTKKAQQKPLDLLKALVILGGANISERALTDMLWPEADGDAAHSAFATTLHRLRTLIGSDSALQLSNGRLTLDTKRCWVDSRSLDASLKSAKTLFRCGSTDAALEHMDRAIELYRGDLLSQDHNTWSIQARDRIKEKFCRALLAAAESLMAQGKTQRAAEYLQAGLAADDCAERLCQKLLEIHSREGRAAEALAVFEKLKRSLFARYGVEPSPATKAAIRRLTGGRANM